MSQRGVGREEKHLKDNTGSRFIDSKGHHKDFSNPLVRHNRFQTVRNDKKLASVFGISATYLH